MGRPPDQSPLSIVHSFNYPRRETARQRQRQRYREKIEREKARESERKQKRERYNFTLCKSRHENDRKTS